MDLYWKSRPVFQHFKYGIEIRIESVNKDNSHSWVRISYGTVKYVNDYIKDDTENLADPQEEESVPTSSGVVAARSKAKAKPQPREPTGTTTIPLSERKWIGIEPSKQDLESYDISKKVVNLLRHNQKLHREEDGAIQFYTIKFHLRDYSLPIQNWSDDRWIACLAAGGGSKRRYQYCSDNLGSIIYLRALQGHSGSNLIDPALQDTVLIRPGIFPYIYHVGSNFNLHSIISNGLVPGGQNLSRRQTVFFLLVDPRKEDHKDPEYIDYSAPRLARYLQNAWKRHQDTVFWVDIDLGIKEGLMFYQTRSNAIILQGTLPAHCIVKVERLRQCKACLKHCSTGIIYCTCEHLMTDDSAENRKYISAVLDTFSIPNIYIRKGRPHGHRYGKAPGCKEYYTANQLARRCRKKKYDSIHDRFIRDKTFRKAMIELGRSEKIILEMDQLASENHTYKATTAEIDVYRGNWWIHSNVANFDSVPTRHQPDFKKALSTMHRLKKAEDEKQYAKWPQSSSSSSWQWQTNWWESDYEYSPQRWYDH